MPEHRRQALQAKFERITAALDAAREREDWPEVTRLELARVEIEAALDAPERPGLEIGLEDVYLDEEDEDMAEKSHHIEQALLALEEAIRALEGLTNVLPESEDNGSERELAESWHLARRLPPERYRMACLLRVLSREISTRYTQLHTVLSE